jgi:cytochrome c1
MMRIVLGVAATLFVGVLATACNHGREDPIETARKLTGGEPARGKAAIEKYGCGGCHTIPGIADATATVGPPLSNVASRQILGGHLTNTPDNMRRWIQKPQEVDPKNVMPDLGVTDQDAHDITAYLYTLK